VPDDPATAYLRSRAAGPECLPGRVPAFSRPPSPELRSLMAIVSVLGMHRSGTSWLAGALEEAGLYAGDVSRKDPFNARGNREHVAIRNLNDDVLATSGGDWSRPPQRVLWHERHERERDRFIAEFSAAAPHWTFKDPRTLLVLPFWTAAACKVLFVGIFRHPVRVARSLGARGAMSLPAEHALRLWIAYNQRLLGVLRRQPFPLLCFDAPPADLAATFAASVEWLERRLCPALPLRPTAAAGFFEQALVHQKETEPGALASGSEASMPGAAALAEAEHLYDKLREESMLGSPAPYDS